jgi:hypothetical protein
MTERFSPPNRRLFVAENKNLEVISRGLKGTSSRSPVPYAGQLAAAKFGVPYFVPSLFQNA